MNLEPLQRKGVVGCRLSSATRRSSNMSVILSLAEMVGLVQHTGKKSMVLEMWVLLVLGM